MIVECKKDIPPLYAATYALRKGHELFKQDNFTEAEKWYTEATNLSENLEIVEYHAIMASCFIGFAATTQQYDADGKCDNNLYLFAYKEIVCLFTEIKKQPSENAYEHILHLSAELMKLIPNTQPKFLPSLRLIIDDCQKELEVLKKPAPDNQAQPSGSGRVPRQPQSYFTIFAAFVLGGLAALAGVALYGRVIAKID
jgi:tetratricopeptide (TPR) repeat protein